MLITGCHAHPATNYQRSPYMRMKDIEMGAIVHVPTGTYLSEDEFMGYIKGSRIVYVAETHRNIIHHDIQLRVLATLAEKYPGKIAVGMEMLRTGSQDEINRWLAGEMSEKEFSKLWLRDWGFNLKLYSKIFDFIKENKIPLVALNAPKSLYSHGAKAPAEGEAEERKIPNIDDSDAYHRAMLEAVLGDPSHGQMNFEDFYMAQLIWEETMAETAADYLKSPDGQDKRMLILAGGGHISYGYGIPRRLFRRLPEPYTTIVPVSVDILNDEKTAKEKGAKLMNVNMPEFPLYIADFLWATPYETIDDTAPMLGVFLKRENERVTITRVMEGSGAEVSGIMEGDAIIALDGEQIAETHDLKYFLSSKKDGDQLTVTVIRAGVELELPLTLKPIPPHKHSMPAKP